MKTIKKFLIPASCLLILLFASCKDKNLDDLNSSLINSEWIIEYDSVFDSKGYITLKLLADSTIFCLDKGVKTYTYPEEGVYNSIWHERNDSLIFYIVVSDTIKGYKQYNMYLERRDNKLNGKCYLLFRLSSGRAFPITGTRLK